MGQSAKSQRKRVHRQDRTVSLAKNGNLLHDRGVVEIFLTASGFNFVFAVQL